MFTSHVGRYVEVDDSHPRHSQHGHGSLRADPVLKLPSPQRYRDVDLVPCPDSRPVFRSVSGDPLERGIWVTPH